MFTQTAVSMEAKINDGEVNYYSNRITMDSESGEIGIDNICTTYISHTREYFLGELVDSTRRIKGFGGTRSPLIKKVTL